MNFWIGLLRSSSGNLGRTGSISRYSSSSSPGSSPRAALPSDSAVDSIPHSSERQGTPPPEDQNDYSKQAANASKFFQTPSPRVPSPKPKDSNDVAIDDDTSTKDSKESAGLRMR